MATISSNGGLANPKPRITPERLELFYSATPNGWKISILLEEAGAAYVLKPLNLGAGDQFSPEFQRISPNGRMPAIRAVYGDGTECCVFESGAVMIALCEEILPKEVGERFLPPKLRVPIYQWLFWMNANLGPMAGQVSHFSYYAPKFTAAKGRADYDHSYALDRYKREYRRLIAVLNRQLALTGGYIVSRDDYTVVDMAVFPWVKPWKRWMGASLEGSGFPHVHRWYRELQARPGLRRGIDVMKAEARAMTKFQNTKAVPLGGNQGQSAKSYLNTMFGQDGLPGEPASKL